MSQDMQLKAHLMRRAGFGSNRQQLEALAARDYEAIVEGLLDRKQPNSMAEALIRRYHPDQSAGFESGGAGSYWLYRLVSTDAPLKEKMTLFWHSVFATGYAKVTVGKVLNDQLKMFRKHGMGSFKTLLLEISRDPAMIIWLDNVDNHNGAINENYGRELLELFSLGVGNYSEEDIKECSRAFTGWSIANMDYMAIKMRNNTARPYGYIDWQFEYKPEDHDNGEKTFLGETGNFSGEDVIDIICKQPATARFISRLLYHSFVADEPPVPQWPLQEAGNPEAIEILMNSYFESNYNIGAMLETLFTSDFFKDESAHFARVKSPVELVVGTLRQAGGFDGPTYDVYASAAACGYMGQALLNPPSVEGWQGGDEWINTGTVVERTLACRRSSPDCGEITRAFHPLQKHWWISVWTLSARCHCQPIRGRASSISRLSRVRSILPLQKAKRVWLRCSR